MKLFFIPALFTLLTLLAADSHAMGKKVQPDPVTKSTLLDGDSTGLVEGCGQQPSPLGMICHLLEGDVTGKFVSFIGPPAKCDLTTKKACVFVDVYNEQGVLVWGDSIPAGKTRVDVQWATLLSRNSLAVSDRGTWAFNTTVYWIDPDGHENSSISRGDIYLRVFKAGYIPLNNVKDDPNFVWTWTDNGFLYRMTAGLRAFVSKAAVK